MDWRRVLLYCACLGGVAFPAATFACPLLSGLINFNCDKTLKITFIGDSIVSGVGDSNNGNKGGYVKRLKKRLPFAKVQEDGVPGITTGRMIKVLKSEFRKRRSSRFFRKAYGADLVIIDVGRNDYWSENANPSTTARNIKRIVNISKRKLKKNGVAPFVVAASMLPTNRGFQRSFIAGINSTLNRMASRRFHVNLPFDAMPNSLLAGDGLHPSSSGYVWLTDRIEDYIYGKLQSQMQKVREDSDADGIYDLFEKKKFKTSPNAIDSDGDGITDGEEVFQLESDPLDPNDPVQEVESEDTIGEEVPPLEEIAPNFELHPAG